MCFHLQFSSKNIFTRVKIVSRGFRDRNNSNVPDGRPRTIIKSVKLSHAGKTGVTVKTVVNLVDPELVGGDEVRQPLVVRGYQVAVVKPTSHSLVRPAVQQKLIKEDVRSIKLT